MMPFTRLRGSRHVVFALALTFFAVPTARTHARVPDLPFSFYTLDNGLEVLLHHDPTLPTVHVEVWYKVGSKDEEPGRTGFAHLFEHLMFQGTKHVPEDAHFRLLREAGASAVNGSTNNDRTNYFQTLPANQLELGLWLESSRMGFLLERDGFKETLENQRDVVKNERRQRIDNVPMGAVSEIQLAVLFPEGHPYRHEVIGHMADLSAATLEDVRAFFLRYYAPNNAILFVGGNFDPARARALIERYFGPLLPAPPVVRRPVPLAPALTQEHFIAMEANIKLPTQFMTWQTVPAYADGEAELDLIAILLTDGKAARLTRKLVHEDKLATNIEAYQWGLEHAGLFELTFSPLPGKSLDAIQTVVDAELLRLTTDLIDQSELERARNKLKTRIVSQLETIQGRAERLLGYHLFAKDAGFIAKDWARFDSVTPASLRRVAQRIFAGPGRLIVRVDPNPLAPIAGRRKP